MADRNSGGVGVLGVLIGALIVIVVGGGLLFATGTIGGGGGHTSTLKVEMPKIGTSGAK
jgi:ABC-type transporter Mla subunit MlaD